MLHIKKGKEQNHKQNTGVNVTQEKNPPPLLTHFVTMGLAEISGL